MKKILLCFTFCATFTYGESEQCSSVLTVKDERFQKYVLNEAESEFNKHCQSNGTVKAKSGGVGISLPKIPLELKLNASSKKIQKEHFCKEYKDWRRKTENQTNYVSQTSKEQWSAYETCINLKNKGVIIEPQINRELVHISLRRGTQNFTFTGFTASPESAFSCKVGDKPINNVLGKIINDTTYLTITCERKPREQSDDILYFDSGTLSVVTDRGGLLIPIAPAVKYGSEYHTVAILNELNKLQERLEHHRAFIDQANDNHQGILELRTQFERFINRQWYDVTKTRKAGHLITNNNPYPIAIAVTADAHRAIPNSGNPMNRCSVRIEVDHKLVALQKNNNHSANKVCSAFAVVPPNKTYKVITGAYKIPKNKSIVSWAELR